VNEVRYVSVFAPGAAPERPPLVLLHGTGGRETDLMPFAQGVAPNYPRLGLRGTVEIARGYAFFRRFPDRRVDEADLAGRVPALAAAISTLFRQNGVHRGAGAKVTRHIVPGGHDLTNEDAEITREWLESESRLA